MPRRQSMADGTADFEGSVSREPPPSRQNAKATEPSAAEDSVARQVVDAAVMVHTILGPGLLESVYEQCLACELSTRGLLVACQVPMAVKYRQMRIEAGFRMDLAVSSTHQDIIPKSVIQRK